MGFVLVFHVFGLVYDFTIKMFQVLAQPCDFFKEMPLDNQIF